VNVSVREDQEPTVNRNLESLLERLTAAVMILDRASCVTYLSHQADPLLAQTRAALLGKTFWEVFPEVVDSPFFRKYHDALRASLAVHAEEYYPPLHKWFELHLLPSPEGWDVYVQEVTQRKRAEEALSSIAAIVESSDDAIFSKMLDGTILSWNSGAERLYGYRASEIVGRPVRTLVPADRHQELQDIMHRLQAGERVDHFETVRIRKDGRLVEVSITLSPVKDAAGQISGASTISRDITERKQFEHQLRLSEHRLRALTEQSADAIQLLSAEGKILYSSDSVERVLGYKPEEIQGAGADPYIHPDDFPYFMEKFTSLLQTPGGQETLEYRVKHKNGSWVWIEATGSNYLHDPHIHAIVGNFRNITERKLIEQRKDDFISMTSHELKTPLTSLLVYTELLHTHLEQEGYQKAVHYLSRMDAQLTRLTKLIADLIDISRVQAGKLVFAEEPVGVDDLVREVVEHIQPTAPRHRILIEGRAQREIVGDKERLGQVVINLLSNAIKYSPQAEKVVVSMTHTSDEVTISVQDFGIGIPPHHQERIFERFYRVSSNQEKPFPGLGIGLYLSHQIIRHHGGRIWVESVEGQGSTFSFALPLKRV